MLEIRCRKTGSQGNHYYIVNNHHRILELELGVTDRDVCQAPNSIVDAILVSHEHQDHDKVMKNKMYDNVRMSDIMRNKGYKVYTCEDLEPLQLYKFGDWEIVPIENEHNVKCYSYFIKVDGKTILFTTDSTIIPKVNVKVDYFMVECNYDMETWSDIVSCKNNLEQELHLANVRSNHCSLEYNIEYFSNLGYRPKGIFTIHKSCSGLLNEDKCKNELSKFTDNYVLLNKFDRIVIND